MKEQKGSITLFLTLILVSVLSLLFTLLDTCRVKGLCSKADMNAATAADSLFAAYCKPLYEEYGLLFFDGSFGTGTLDTGKMAQKLQEENAYNLGQFDGIPGENGSQYYRLSVQQADVSQYELATDQNGNVFRHAVLRTVQDEKMADMASDMCALMEYVAAEKLSDEQNDPAQRIENGDDDLENAQRQQQEAEQAQQEEQTQPSQGGQQATSQPQEGEEQQSQPQEGGQAEDSGQTSNATAQEREEAEKQYRESMENAIDVMENIAKGGELGMFTKGATLSETELDLSDALEKRNKNQGNMNSAYELGTFQRVLYDLYLKKKFSSYVKSVNDHNTKYELEYIIAGKDSDKENLRSVIHRLFLLREGANFIYRQQDPVTQERATAIAAALSACFPAINPIIIKEAIITAQSVGDSVSDVKDLLAGKRVALYKGGVSTVGNVSDHSAGGVNLSKGTSSVDLSKRGSSVDLKKPDTTIDDTKPETTKSWEAGLCYMDYLQIFLFLEDETKVTMRTMDLIEWSVRQKPGYAAFRMDCMLARAKGTITYDAPLVFSIFGTPNGESGWTVESDFSCSYEKEG